MDMFYYLLIHLSFRLSFPFTAVCRYLGSWSEFFEYKRIGDFEKKRMDMGVSPAILHGFG
jgi:hypothetical protein